MGLTANFSPVREAGILEPQVLALSNERHLVITGVPKTWRCDAGARACYYIAMYVLRAALENGCTTIEIRRGPHHRHLFQVLELIEAHRRYGSSNLRHGKITRPRFRRKTPPYWATWTHRSRGSVLDRLRNWHRVPANIRTLFAPSGASKE